MRVGFHPEASLELSEAASYYAEIDLDLGQRFLVEMERLVQEIRSHPRIFREFEPPARRHLSRTFPYGVIYFEQSERIWIVAIMPLRRRPGYWKSRL